MSEDTPSVETATEYCTYCPKLCRCSCPAAEAENRETVTPWGMMRLYEFIKDGSVAPDAETAETFWHCMGCRRCQEWCLHDNDVPEAMWKARREMANRGVVPAALEGFTDSFRQHDSPHGELPDLTGDETGGGHGWALEEVFDAESGVVFVPDCETRHRRPGDVLRAGKLLERLLGRKVALHAQLAGGSQCCGFPLGAAGDRSGWVDHWRQMQRAWPEGAEIVCECPAMVAQLREGTSFGPESESGLPGHAVCEGLAERVMHVIELLDEKVPEVPPESPVSGEDWMLHDACFTTRQLSLADATRRVLNHLCVSMPDDFHVNGSEAPCCGGPSHYHVVAPEASERLANERIEQMRAEAGEAVVCGTATCRKAFARSDEEAVAGDVLEIAFEAYDIGQHS